MKRIFRILQVAFIVLAVSCKTSQNQQAIDYAVKIDSLIQTTTPRKFNGVILITKNDTIKYSKAYGYSNHENKTPLILKDNFRIQSNSKQITAVLTLKEFEKGNIDLNIPIKNYLPELKQTWADTVTVHHLLNMTSGIVALDETLQFKPGTAFRYSNPAYSLVGRIIKNVTGKRYVEVANELFKELELKNTFAYELNKYNGKVINGYVNTDNNFELYNFYSAEIGITEEWWENFVPAGGIISNVKDLNIWDTKLHKGEILKPETYKLMSSYEIASSHPAFSKELGYGYGVSVSENNLKYIGHPGKGLGFVNIKMYVPKKNVNVIVLENQYHRDDIIVYHFQNKIMDIVMNSSLVND